MPNDTHDVKVRPLSSQEIGAMDETLEAITQLNSLLAMINNDDGFDAFDSLGRPTKMGYVWTCSRLARTVDEAFQRLVIIRAQMPLAAAEEHHA
jgi:hypothetical protein